MLTSDENPRVLFDGGARSGKTVSIVRYMILRALAFPGSKQVVARMRQVDLRNSGWISFREHLHDYFPSSWYRFFNKDFEIRFRNDSIIKFTGLDTQDRIEFILGTEWVTIFVNEATQTTYDVLTTLMTRLSQKVAHKDYPDYFAMPKFIMDCNPRHNKHWIFQLCIRNPPIMPHTDPEVVLDPEARWARLNWSPFDNKIHLHNNFFITLNNLPMVKRARMRDGIWKNNEGAVYEEFDEDTHICHRFEIPKNWTTFRGIDFGYSNPFACLWAAIDFDGTLYVYNEHYQREMIVRDHAKIINQESMGRQFRWTTADWDAEDRATLESEGIKTVAADKRVPVGIEMVKRRLKVQGNGKPRLFIMEGTAPNLVSEFYDYMWDPNSPENKEKKEVPLKSNDHAMDALRYIVIKVDSFVGTSRFQGIYEKKDRIEDVLGYREPLAISTVMEYRKF